MAAVGQARTGAGIRTPLFLVGVALALLAFVAMFALGIVFVNRGGATQQVSILVASQDIPAREPINVGMVKFETIPATAVPPGAFYHVSDVLLQTSLLTILQGQPITSNMVATNADDLTKAGASAFVPIPAGYVAMTMPTDEQEGVAGYIAQGDYINVIAAVNTDLFSKVNPRTVTRTVFTDVYVIRVGPQTAVPKQGQPQGLASSLTVVMSICDAQYMEWLLVNATVRYALLSSHDYGKDPLANPDPTCPPTSEPPVVGPAAVDARWGFLKG